MTGMNKTILWSLLLAPMFLAGAAGAQTKDVLRGKVIFEDHCANCHDNSQQMINDIGPALFGVVGRRAGSVGGYDYSPALKAANTKGERWNARTLDRFLTSPEKMHQGTNMPMNFAKRSDRKGLVAYLKTLKP